MTKQAAVTTLFFLLVAWTLGYVSGHVEPSKRAKDRYNELQVQIERERKEGVSQTQRSLDGALDKYNLLEELRSMVYGA